MLLLELSASIIDGLSSLTLPSFSAKPSTLGCIVACWSIIFCRSVSTNLLKPSIWWCTSEVVLRYDSNNRLSLIITPVLAFHYLPVVQVLVPEIVPLDLKHVTHLRLQLHRLRVALQYLRQVAGFYAELRDELLDLAGAHDLVNWYKFVVAL